MKLTRRDLILIGACVAAAPAGAAFYTFYIDRPDWQVHALVETLNDPTAAAEIGAAYLSTRAAPTAAPFLARLEEKLTSRGLTPGADITTRRAHFAELIREDFMHNATVDIEGWSLSQTEADLSALAAFQLGANPVN